MSGFTAALRRLQSQVDHLVDRHEKARDLQEFHGWAGDPVGFVREVLREKDPGPWPRQVEIMEAVQEEPLVVVRSANAVGKDWTAARLALWWVYARRGLVLVTGPTERQIREVVMGEVARAWTRAQELPGELYATSLRLGREETAGILAFTSTEASRLTGFHAPRVMAILTEAQGVEEFAWEGLLACATGDDDRILAVGNPLAPRGRFYSVSRPGSGWRSIRISAHDHPNLQQGRTVIPGGPSIASCERIAREWGRSSGVYRARVEGDWPDSSEEGLFRRSWLDAAAERWRDEEFRARSAGEPPVVALDVARYGADRTVAGVARGPVLERFVDWAGCDLMETVEKAEDVLAEEGLKRPAGNAQAVRGRVVVDVVGLGSGVADRLRELRYPVHDFNAGAGARDRKKFLKARAESHWRLRERLEAGEVALPPDEELMDELLAVTWKPTADGRVQVTAKDEIRGLLGRSPDKADAAVMALGVEPPRDTSSRFATSQSWIQLGTTGIPMGYEHRIREEARVREEARNRAAAWGQAAPQVVDSRGAAARAQEVGRFARGAIRDIASGRPVVCPVKLWPEVRAAIQEKAAAWMEGGDEVRAQVALEEVKRLDGKFGLNGGREPQHAGR